MSVMQFLCMMFIMKYLVGPHKKTQHHHLFIKDLLHNILYATKILNLKTTTKFSNW